MEVSQIADLDTHAIIGGSKAQAFGMSDSAEFFTVLSDTLYRDKKRAVVREVISNAWDAHIMGGCTDRAIEIQLSDFELVIRDYGPGIPDDKMVPVYCIYGASTKVADENQNGGFGLGCKAPFAYTDHFTVTSCHAGTRTVYAISRGGTETDGKPGLRQMVSVPTDETGLTVTIPIVDRDDVSEFLSNIRTVVRQGGIKATLNGVELPTYDFTEARKTGMAVVGYNPDLSESVVYCLYGTVLYPVSRANDVISDLLRQVEFEGEKSKRYIIAAKPGTIGVTPSRESLSNNRRTIATITELLRRLLGAMHQHAHLGIKHLEQGVGEYIKLFDLSTGLRSVLDQLPSGLEADPKVIGMRAAASNFVEKSDHGDRMTLLLRVGQRKFPEFRRVYRRMRRYVYKGDSWHRADYAGKRLRFNSTTAEHEIFIARTRLFVRLASKAGVLKGLVQLDFDGLARAMNSHQASKLGDTLLVGPTKAALREWISAQRRAAREDDTIDFDPFERHAALVIKKPTETQMMTIRALAGRYKLRLIEVEAPVVVKKPRVPKPKVEKVVEAEVERFWSISDVVRSARNRHYFSDLSDRSVDKPAFYISGNEGFSTESLKLPTRKTGEIHRLYPNTVVASGIKEKQRLDELKVKPVIGVLLDEFEALLKRPEAGFVIAAATGNITKHNASSRCERFAESLAKKDLFTAKLLTRSTARLTGKSMRLRKLYDVVTTLDLEATSPFLDKRVATMTKAHDLAREWAAKNGAKDGFDYLAPLLAIYDRGTYIEDWPAMRALVKTLQALKKRAPKSTKLETVSVETDELEEAA